MLAAYASRAPGVAQRSMMATTLKTFYEAFHSVIELGP